jgi:hypothetical protein
MCPVPGGPARSDIDAEPRSRSATGAVIIAVIFLAVLGTGVGIVLGSQAKNDKGNNVGNDTTVSASPSPADTGRPTADPSNSGGTGNTRTKTPTNTKSYRSPNGRECPQYTEEAAGTSLSLKLYIRTSSAEVWICQGGGRTVYQGHLAGRPFNAATSDTTLYIGSVNYEAGVYSATNGNTTYYVSPERLRREENGVEKQNEAVVETYSG